MVKKMVDIFGNKDFVAFFSQERCLATTMVDGVAVNEDTALDES